MKRRDVIVAGILMMASARFVARDAQQRLKTLAVFSPPSSLDADLSTSSAGLG